MTGPEGTRGMAGPSGLVGMTGLERPVWMTGLERPVGVTGLERPVGVTGSRGAEGPEGSGGPEGVEGPTGRGPGTAGPCGLAWPPRSLELPDTIGLPVTFAVSARGLFPWLRHVLLGPVAYRRSVCRGRGPTPP
jgi:hypothetical protein